MVIKSWVISFCLKLELIQGLLYHSLQSNPMRNPVCVSVNGLCVYKLLWKKKTMENRRQSDTWIRNQTRVIHITISGLTPWATHPCWRWTAEVYKYLKLNYMGIKLLVNCSWRNQELNPGVLHHSQTSNQMSSPGCFDANSLEVYKNLWKTKNKKRRW